MQYLKAIVMMHMGSLLSYFGFTGSYAGIFLGPYR